MKRRLVIVTEIIAPYRLPVFNELTRHPDIDLHVIFLAETDPTQRQWLVNKSEIAFSYEVLPSWRKRIGGCNLLLNWRVDRALRRALPDVILCGGYNYIASWQALRWAKQNQVHFWLWAESTPDNFRSGWACIESLKSRFIEQCDGFVVPGAAAFDYVKTHGGIDKAVLTAPNAVDTGFFARHAAITRMNAKQHRERLGLPDRFFLFVGRLVPEKGVFDLLEAYGALPPELRSDLGLVLVGDGQARANLEKRAAVVKPGVIKITGFAQREELASYYALADVFVFPTHTDAWGLVVNEAMSCGLPVICSRAAGCVRDLIGEGVNGHVIEPHEIRQLSAVMEQLGRNPELARQLGARGRERISSYSPSTCAAGIAQAVLRRRTAA